MEPTRNMCVFRRRTSTLESPRCSACANMYSRCDEELLTPVIRASGKWLAIQSVRDPHPHPSSKMRWPSSICARSHVMRNALAYFGQQGQ